MDQINALKGYGKVTHLELGDQIPPPSKPNFRSRKQKSLLIITAVVLSTLVVGAYIHNSTGDKSSKSPSLNSNSADSIVKIVCNVTRYPDSCFTSIISLNGSPEPDPEVILKLSLQVSLDELSNLSGSLKNLSANGDGGGALKDCESQIEDAIERVNESKAEMEADAAGEKTLTESKIGDIQTWMSSAMTDQESCLDGLEEMDSTSFLEVKTRMRKSVQYVSNSLAIVANIHVILAKLNMPLH
ncbi:pectinesterase 3 [Momordica charantia]|uniref:pectinesterase n=1 Tax=Momordica charantia TaxID=3673 RepID=A0A6J1C685_MOMCH|nr:pectinesterase 3 [Momordica charantia]